MLTVGSVIVRSHKKIESQSVILRTLVRNDRTHQQPITKNAQAIALLTSWLNETDTSEQEETWEYLKKHLDEDRLSDRKLFL